MLLPPHIGWTVDRTLEEFVADTTTHVECYLDERLDAATLLNPAALEVERPRVAGVDGSTGGKAC